MEARLDSLELNNKELARRIHKLEDWQDVIGSSALLKRIWWVLCGWRWKHIGRWR